ncbi:MAG TPA: hypothetical protein VFJ72_00235 [Rubrobacteraceae bacterium]|nr:hypothetical protein [Rubrobacteraceae bacterium]
MRKLMVLVAMLAMMMVAAAPAFAQATGGDVDLSFVDASQSATVDVTQSQFGDATATSGDVGSAADASIDNSLDVSVTQVNGGFVDDGMFMDDDFGFILIF